MKQLFNQGGQGSTGIMSNKQAIARRFGVKQSEVVYFSSGQALTGFKVIYDKPSQRAYALPSNLGSVTAVTLVDGLLTHSGGTVDLGALAVLREEFVTLVENFTSGFTIRVKNELVVDAGVSYRWDGSLPKVVNAGGNIASDGVGIGKWIGVGEAALRGEMASPGGAGIVGGITKPVTWVGFAGGADPTGVKSSKAAFQAADASAYQIIYVPEGNYNLEDYIPTKLYFGAGKLVITGGSIRSLDTIPNTPNYLAPNTVAGGGASFLGQFNTLYGYNVGGNFGPSAKRNSLFGHNLGSGDTIYPEENLPLTGSDNNGFGYHCLKKLQSGNSNNAHGGDALNELKTGNHNNAMGQGAGQQIVDLSDGCYFGSLAGGRADSGNGRTSLFGRDAARENRNTSNNASFGWGSGRGVTPTPTQYTGNGVNTSFSVPGYIFTGTKQVRVDIDGVNILPVNYSVTGLDGVVTLNFAPAVGANIVLTATIGSASWSESSIFGARAAYKFTSGLRASIFGFGAAENATVINNSLVMGDEAAYTANNISGSIIIGPRAYRAVTDIQNKFIVANQASTPYMDGTMVGPGDSGNYLRLDANFSPNTANTRLCGTSSRPWAGGATQTAFDITSDGTMKTDKDSIPDAVLDAWGRVGYYQYRLIDSVEKKGDAARLHLGVIAQEILRVFEDAGLNACDYGIVCLTEWDDEYEEIMEDQEFESLDEDGKPDITVRPVPTGEYRLVQVAGSRWSVRYEECLVLESELRRRDNERMVQRYNKLEERIKALESK